MEKKKVNVGIIVTIIIYIITGGIVGFMGANLIAATMAGTVGVLGSSLSFAILLIIICVAMYLQIIIHEGGHYIFGKLSGYKLASFRIGSIMLINSNNGIQCKKFKIAGTGGQCLMAPPICSDSTFSFPFIMYNLGGIAANLTTSVLGMLVFALIQYKGLLSVFLFVFSVMGVAMALINGIPMKVGGIANDGYNAIALRKDTQARRAFWLQLMINGKISEGQRLKDMPEEWFELYYDADMNNPLICACGVFKGSRFNDQMEFGKARELYRSLLKNATGMLEIHKNEIRCELLFYEIIGENRKEERDRLYNKALKKYIKATLSYVSRQRLMYAYELLSEKNMARANKLLKSFEKACKTYPYASEIESERELIGYIQQLSEEREKRDKVI